MNVTEMKERLNKATDRLVPVAGTLMAVACEQDFEHTETCTCQLCRAFLATHDCMNELQDVVRELEEVTSE